MDPSHTSDATRGTSLAAALDQDCLQELFSRCRTSDLLPLRQSCSLFNSILKESQLVWARRMWVDYGLSISMRPSVRPGALFSLAQQIYTATANDDVRFQGVLVNGSVDELNMWYWVDNLFKADRTYFCSDGSANVDCLGMLLDGVVERETQYNKVRRYMQRRCRYAAALFEQLQHPGDPDIDTLTTLVEQWTDQHLESFFLALVGNLNENINPMGRLLFYDVPSELIQEEQEKLRGVASFLRERLQHLKRGLIHLPGDMKTLFDASVVDKFRPEFPIKSAGIIHELKLSRMGSLTCPVSAGVIFAGIIDMSGLEGLNPRVAAERLQAVTQDPICSAFNGLETFEAVEEQIARGNLPRISSYSRLYEGVICQFDSSWDSSDFDIEWLRRSGSGGSSGQPLIKWKPLVWFKFHSREEAEFLQGVQAPVAEPGSLTQTESEGEEAAAPTAAAVDDDEFVHNGGDPWTLEDLEALGQGQPMVVGQPLPPADHDAAADAEVVNAVHAQPIGIFLGQEHDSDTSGSDEEEGAGELDEEEDEGADVPLINHTEGRNELHVKLGQPVVANIMMVKLINQENLMEELMDGHAYPNIDMTYVEVIGKKIALPQGVDLKPWPC